MMKLEHKMTLEITDEGADCGAECRPIPRRERRRRFWKHLGYLVMLIGAVSGLLTLLVMLAERWW
jgi:predicted nucleic acid-binding Zn ribbon protein